MSSKSIKGSLALESYGSISDKDTKGDKRRILDSPEHDSDSAESTEINVIVPDRENLDKSCFFHDGVSKVDFVLVYIERTDKPTTASDNKMKSCRKKFKSNLTKAGLILEEDVIASDKKNIHYIKINAPWDVLCYYAEDLSFRAPLQFHPHPITNWSAGVLEMLKIPNIMEQDVPNQPPDFYTCQFKTSKLENFLGGNDHMNFFTNSQRSSVVWEILSTTVYGRRKKAEIGIERLVNEKVISAAFPLHDGPYQLPPKPYNPEDLNMRQILYKYWARWGCWYKYQPLDHIRSYFGERIAIYFAWLGFYTGWLLPAAVVGLLVFLSGAFNVTSNPISKQICDSGKEFKMCPVCDERIGCEFYYLSDVCIYTKLAYMFDHPGTVFYALFVSFWAISFLEFWKRKNVDLAHHWDVLGFEEEEERPRPAYSAKAEQMEVNPITGINEPYFPNKKRVPRVLSGMVIIGLMICLVLIFIVAVIMYRVLIAIPLFQNKELRPRAPIIASTSAAIVNLMFIMLLGKVYESLAVKLTEWEMHRTQTDHDDQLIFKVFLFQFVNFYSSIFYIAFFKGRFVGYPGHYERFFGLRQEECSSGGCLMELAQQLAVINIGKQLINNVQEVIVPKLKTYLHRFKIRTKGAKASMEETGDFSLIPHEGLFNEYLEMILQFGFITIFVAAFPLAPLFALLNNWVEIRLDGQKLVMETRRPVAERAEDIGVWFSILNALAHLAVISNAFLIAFTSEFLPKLLYQNTFHKNLDGYINYTLAYSPNNTLSEECRYIAFRDREGHYTIFYWRLLAARLAFVIVFEHFVFVTFKLIDVAVPDVPESLEQKIKRERYLAKQALADTETAYKFNTNPEEETVDAISFQDNASNR